MFQNFQPMIKKIFISALFSIPILLCAQNIVIYDTLGNMVNGQTITCNRSVADSLIRVHFEVKNTFTDTLVVKMRRSEIGKVMGTQNYYCWSICYSPVFSGAKPTWTDIGSVAMKPDSLYENFSAYYLPNGITGVAGFHYVLYDVNNTNDTAFVDIMFDIAVGIENAQKMVSDLAVFPNPANEGIDINCGNYKSGSVWSAEIFNLTGEKMETRFIPANESSIHINTAGYSPGIYFCTLKEDGKIQVTKKIVINRIH